MAVTCENLATITGWRCATVADRTGESALYVVTPMTFADGRPVDFYLRLNGARYELTDGGMALLALRGLGYILDDRRNWRAAQTIAERFGFELTERGELRTLVAESDLTEATGRMIQLFAAFIAWEAERFADGDSDFSLTQEVERILRLKGRPLEIGAAVRSNRGDLVFDFRWGETYVDALQPNAQAVASRLRKTILLREELGDQVDVLYVLDDRRNREDANRELNVISHMARATRFTDLARMAA